MEDLNPEQRVAFQRYLSGRNFFLTGGAGTGKSFLLKKIVQHLRQNVEPHRIGICGLTGVSAIPINGRTLHSWAGIGLGEGSVETLYKKVRKNQESWARWSECRCLIIDEVSMMSLELFEKLHQLGVMIRKNTGLFGGMQVILSGDFLQLPPVRGDFCFESNLWKQAFGNYNGLMAIVRGRDGGVGRGGLGRGGAGRGGAGNRVMYLHRIIRQEDVRFNALLSRVRLGMVSQSDKEMLVARKIGFNYDQFDGGNGVDGGGDSGSSGGGSGGGSAILPTRLYPYRKDVELINDLEMDRLLRKGAPRIEAMPQYGLATTEFAHEMARNHGEMKRYRFLKSDIAHAKGTGFRTVMPKLSPADYNNAVSWCGGAQVMLTYNLDVERGLVNGSRGVVEVARNENGNPMVRFMIHESVKLDDGSYRTESKPEVVEVSRVRYEIDHYYYKLVISQYPLMLAWAVTIHRAQSATLDCVETDLSEVFSPGQTYVTLSRVRDLEKLYLLGINFSKIRADPRAVKYYEDLGVICQVRYNSNCIPDGVSLGHAEICRSCLKHLMSRILGPYLSDRILFYL